MSYIKSKRYKDMVKVSIDVIDFCQLNCEYCFQNSKTHSFLPKHNLIKILHELNKIKFDVQIIIMGGEPTLYPHLNFMLDELNKIKSVKEILLFTNGMRNLESLHYNNKLIISFSYHQTQHNKNYILNNINRVKCDFYITTVDVKNLDLTGFENYKVILLPIETKHGVIINNKNLFLEKEIIINNKQYSLYEYYKMNFNNFYGWLCHVREYTIDLNLNCKHYCLNKIIKINQFSEYVNNINHIKCQHTVCKKSNKACIDFFITSD